jgi:hypothetical protein
LKGLLQDDVWLWTRPEEKLGDKTVLVVRANTGLFTSTTVMLDKETFLCLRTVEMAPVPGDASRPLDMVSNYYDDYKQVGGLMIPMIISTFKNGETYRTMMVRKLEFLDKVDHKLFEKPTEGFDSEVKMGFDGKPVTTDPGSH